MGSYDNRRRGLSSIVRKVDVGGFLPNRIRNKRIGGTKPHFQIRIGGKRIAYCYIRKNGTSSFKRLFVEQSDMRSARMPEEDPKQFMNRYHRLHDITLVERCDHRIFVCRHPARRLVSLFANKFIAKSHNLDIFRSYYRVTGKDPDKATFREFVFEYLRDDFSILDPHVRPQSRHLLSIEYTDAIVLEGLFEAMRGIIGDQMARRYFARRVNESSSHALYSLPNAPDLTAAELEKLFKETGSTPRNDDFLPAEILEKVAHLYEQDYALYRHVSRMQSTRSEKGLSRRVAR